MADNVFDLQEILLSSSLSNTLKYDGLENTAELVDTVKDLFCGYKSELIVASVKGTVEKFHAEILTGVKTEEEVESLKELYMSNTEETLKKATTR